MQNQPSKSIEFVQRVFIAMGVLASPFLAIENLAAQNPAPSGVYPISSEISQSLSSQSSALSPASAFGESIDLAAGSLRFANVDIAVSGNGPDITIARSFDLARNSRIEFRTLWKQDFADWELELPRLKTTGEGGGGIVNYKDPNLWVVDSPSKYQRCSQFSKPRQHSWLWWNGVQLALPDGQSQELLKRVPEDAVHPQPGSAADYPVVTTGDWNFSCLRATLIK